MTDAFSNREAATLSGERVGFSFGRNWARFAADVDDAQIEDARRSLRESFGGNDLAGHAFLDIGCGSGLFSYCAHLEGASSILSLDVDPASVATTNRFRERAGDPDSWTIRQGSILDEGFRSTLPAYDRVYSWGVLHHTGAMWRAVDAALQLVAPEGLFCLALYTRPNFLPVHMTLKRAYNRLPANARPLFAGAFGSVRLAKRLVVNREAPAAVLRSYAKTSRGMSFWRDVDDWLGGLPFEFTDVQEVRSFVEPKGFSLENVIHRSPGANDEYLLRREPARGTR